MKKLFRREYKVKGSRSANDQELTGKVVINSQLLKCYIGRKVRIYVYVYGVS